VDAPYEGQDFNLALTITSTGVRLGRDIEIDGLPPGQVLLREPFRELPTEHAMRNGELLETRRYRCEARARRPGTLTIRPKLRVTILSRQSPGGRLDVETPHDIMANQLQILARPLPAQGRPSDFSGAIGSFSLEVTVSPTNTSVKNLVQIVTRIRGEGNIDDVLPPRIAAGRHFWIYDPLEIPAQKADAAAFEQLLVPQSTNAVAVPPVSFSYFDPRAGRYITLTRGPFPLQFQASPSFLPHSRSAVAAAIRSLLHGNDAVVLRDQYARFAPFPTAAATFRLRRNAPVRILSVSGQWARVAAGNNVGWLPRTAIGTQ